MRNIPALSNFSPCLIREKERKWKIEISICFFLAFLFVSKKGNEREKEDKVSRHKTLDTSDALF
jgi:hypothetical protein